jgi:hypothetical protein
MTITTDSLTNVPHPAGAVHVDGWYDTQFGIDHVRRYFRGSSLVVERNGEFDEDIAAEIYGTQGPDGDVTRHNHGHQRLP